MAALGLICGLLLIVKLGKEQGIDPDKLRTLVGSAHAALSQKAPNVIGLFVVGTL